MLVVVLAIPESVFDLVQHGNMTPEINKYNEKYFKKFNIYPSEITILTYDALGLIYYTWKKNGMIKSMNDFLFKNKIKGKIGTFSFKNQKVIQDLEIYKTENKKFIKF